jgi:dimethylaniline monooxygenase (N-oxide forming)
MGQLPRICIIGAGSSGIAVIKAMKERGFDVTCYEKGDDIGGNWYFRNTNRMSAAYESLHINTDSKLMEYRDYPMPPDTPDYPGHRVIKAYFDDYVRHFRLREHIRFNTGVTQARRRPAGGWDITLDNGQGASFDVLVVANGHHWDPLWPDPPYPGEFEGEQIHAHDYLNPSDPIDFHGKRVLVVGMGNSAMDIACELSRPGIAERLYLSARHGVWILPKYLFGIPMSRLGLLPHWIPWQLGSVLTRLAVTINVGAPWRFGLPRPDHRMLQAHPTISEEILMRLGSGDVLPRPGIHELRGEQVAFVDGREEPVDVIVWCTGYRLSLPFFDPAFISAPNNDLPLWERMVKPGIDDLFFVGLLQPLGAIMPIAEAQAHFIGEHLIGQVALPPPEAMERAMAREREAMFRRYKDRAPRHTMQVDFKAYLHRLKRHARRGRRLAESQGTLLPVPARVAPGRG